MAIDGERPVVRLCVAGVQAEQAGRGNEAAARYAEAWALAEDAVDRAVAAHYQARVQDDDAERLRWNQLALEQALAAGEEARSLLPSLHLNLGHSYETTGDLQHARNSYRAAERSLEEVLDAALADSLGPPIRRALARVVGHQAG